MGPNYFSLTPSSGSEYDYDEDPTIVAACAVLARTNDAEAAERTNQLLQELSRHSLIQRRHQQKAFSTHRLVLQVQRDALSGRSAGNAQEEQLVQRQRAQVVAACMRMMEVVFEFDDSHHETWAASYASEPHVVSLLSYAVGSGSTGSGAGAVSVIGNVHAGRSMCAVKACATVCTMHSSG